MLCNPILFHKHTTVHFERTDSNANRCIIQFYKMSSVDDIFKSNSFKGQKRGLSDDSHQKPSKRPTLLHGNENENDEDYTSTVDKYALLNPKEREIQEYIDSHENDFHGPEVYDKKFLTKLLVQLEKALNENTQQRLDHLNEPEKFFESENKLYNSIRQLSIISETDLYDELEKSGSLDTIVSLITHENISVGTQTLQILEELFEPENECGVDAMNKLATALLKEGLTSQITQFLNMTEKEQYEGFSNLLNLVSNITKNDANIGIRILKKTKLLQWSVERFAPKGDGKSKEDSIPNSIIYHFAETLSELFILVPKTIAVFDKNGVEMLLLQLATLRQIDSLHSEERDFFRDVFDILVSAVRYPWVNEAFQENEGIELMMMLLQIKRGANNKSDTEDEGDGNGWIKANVLKVLAESTKGFASTGSQTCLSIVENGGLKILFSLLRKNKRKPFVWEILTIFASMLEWLELGSKERDRFTAKFAEKSYEIVILTTKYFHKTQLSKKITANEEENEDEINENLKQSSRQHTLCVILAWLIIEFDEFKNVIVKEVSLSEIRNSLLEYLEEVDFSSEQENKEDASEKNSFDKLVIESDKVTSDMLRVLISHIE
ncbi:uncharacterized protein SAPINGB_P000223 [Magnusiomyces paraingens]|uniref:Beta-catenin-like protein 1 N-terminal domain-containing protein n=1 Tax=Magnusiomyces paraingens TaxID=2606893 RepID=A0A5E8B2U5_9ASCO|nr:uncharacterized protein SAPINGB_P000223 [Saprochaete ingens]VVT43942.1 unnamed protein product [Saprochaete ingens]